MNAQVMPKTHPSEADGPARFRHRAREPHGGRELQGRQVVRSTSSRKYGPIEMSPAIHGLHYGSTCFEGFKAYRWADGSINVFRMDKHIARMQKSAECLVLPKPDPAQLATMITGVVEPGAGRSARGPGRAVPAADAVRHRRINRRRHVTRDRGHAGRACEPGLGLLREG